jgi:hypothetical protein
MTLQKLLRVGWILALVLGTLFKLEHWPYANQLFLLSWLLTLLALLMRLITQGFQPPVDIARDTFHFGVVSLIVMRVFHLPGKGYALGLMVLGGLAVLWHERRSYLPGANERWYRPWLFTSALVLVVVGVLFRIQHWPHSSLLLVAGLSAGAAWMISAGRQEQ